MRPIRLAALMGLHVVQWRDLPDNDCRARPSIEQICDPLDRPLNSAVAQRGRFTLGERFRFVSVAARSVSTEQSRSLPRESSNRHRPCDRDQRRTMNVRRHRVLRITFVTGWAGRDEGRSCSISAIVNGRTLQTSIFLVSFLFTRFSRGA